MITAPGLSAISAIAAPNNATISRNTLCDPYISPILAPIMMNAATTSEYVTIAVLNSGGRGVLKLETMSSMDTCNEETLEIIRIWAMAITTIGNQRACGLRFDVNVGYRLRCYGAGSPIPVCDECAHECGVLHHTTGSDTNGLKPLESGPPQHLKPLAAASQKEKGDLCLRG